MGTHTINYEVAFDEYTSPITGTFDLVVSCPSSAAMTFTKDAFTDPNLNYDLLSQTFPQTIALPTLSSIYDGCYSKIWSLTTTDAASTTVDVLSTLSSTFSIPNGATGLTISYTDSIVMRQTLAALGSTFTLTLTTADAATSMVGSHSTFTYTLTIVFSDPCASATITSQTIALPDQTWDMGTPVVHSETLAAFTDSIDASASYTGTGLCGEKVLTFTPTPSFLTIVVGSNPITDALTINYK